MTELSNVGVKSDIRKKVIMGAIVAVALFAIVEIVLGLLTNLKPLQQELEVAYNAAVKQIGGTGQEFRFLFEDEAGQYEKKQAFREVCSIFGQKCPLIC